MGIRIDRRRRIQRYPVSQVESAIAEAVFGEENQQIVKALFLEGETYEEVAERLNMSPRGLYKRMGRIIPLVEAYLREHEKG